MNISIRNTTKSALISYKSNNISKPPAAFSNFTVSTPNDTFVHNTETPEMQNNENNKWLTREVKIVAAAGLATAGILAATIILKGRYTKRALSDALAAANAQKTKAISDIQETASKRINELTESLTNANKLNSELTENKGKVLKQFEGLLDIPENMQKVQKQYVQQYSAELSDQLAYNPLKLPEYSRTKIRRQPWIHSTDIKQIPPIVKSESLSDVINTATLKSEFDKTGKLILDLPVTPATKPILDANSTIAGKPIKDIGTAVNTDFKLAYGQRVQWTEEKIARDIVQNFYDGHGHTLDGTTFVIEKLSNDKYKIKISGLATFDYENLQYLGSGDKIQDLANAGGFGEGAKVLVANLLGKGDTKAVKYGCADWELTFDGTNGIMRRLLNKVDNPIEGNFIEFETENKHLANSIIDSINYFKHSKNPDFGNCTIVTPDFAFKFLGENQKGNLYLTQRFEYDKAGQWSEGLDNIQLAFMKKPDPEEFKKITGTNWQIDRDRTFLTNTDIKNLTRYYSAFLTNEQLLQTIMSTKSMWGKIDKNNTPALYHFLEGVIETCNARHIGIDIGAEKYAAKCLWRTEVATNTLQAYGYKFLPAYFKNIGFLDVEDAFKSLSIHNPLMPDITEIKKLQLLEKAVGIIQENITSELHKHINNMPNINFNFKNQEISYYVKRLFDYLGIAYKQTISADQQQTLLNSLPIIIKQRMQKIYKSGNSEELNKFTNMLSDVSETIDVKSAEYLKTLKNLLLITKEDVTKPRYIFDRTKEIAQNTLGEAIVENRNYLGHWVDREYLQNASFNEILGTWLHEMCHKSGGDGSAEFTYTLTDMLRVLLTSNGNNLSRAKLTAIEEVYNKLNQAAV